MAERFLIRYADRRAPEARRSTDFDSAPNLERTFRRSLLATLEISLSATFSNLINSFLPLANIQKAERKSDVLGVPNTNLHLSDRGNEFRRY